MPIMNRIADFHADMTAWRQDFHAHPETAFEEVRTAAHRRREAAGIRLDEVVTGIAKTGVVGVIRGQGDTARAIGLRADMDALPIHEQTGVPHASTDAGQDARLRA